MQRSQYESLFIIILSIIIVAIPLLHSKLLMWLDYLPIRIVIIGLLLISIQSGPVIGILSLLCIGVLFIERNRRKLIHIQQHANRPLYTYTSISRHATTKEESVPQKNVIVAPADVPEDDDDDVCAWYVPADDNEGSFDPVENAVSLNEKHILDSIPGGEKAASVFNNIL